MRRKNAPWFRLSSVLPVYWKAASILLSVWCVPAATYHVALTGSDENPGTEAKPWKSIHRASETAVAGDTVLVGPGIYTNDTYFYPRKDGSVAQPIVFKATGGVTNQFGFYINRKGIVLDGFTFQGKGDANRTAWLYGYGIFFGRNAADVIVRKCAFVDNAGPIGCENGSDRNPQTMAKNLTIADNVFDRLRGTCYLMTYGTGHRIERNVFANGESSDALRPFGSNIVIRANVFTNMHSVEGVGNHPDILQLFGNNPHWGEGFWGTAIVFEGNTVLDSPIQLFQLGQNGVTNSCNIIVRNNVFANSTMQASISFPEVQFYNNTFYRCNVGGNTLLQYGYYDPSDPSLEPRGLSHGGKVINNAFIECNTTGFAGYVEAPVTFDFVTRRWVTWADPKPELDLFADYNFVSAPGGLPKKVFSEPHGINGGDAKLVAPEALNFRPAEGSVLIGRGTSIPGLMVDFDGNPRPARPTIGAFEFAAAPAPASPAGFRLTGN